MKTIRFLPDQPILDSLQETLGFGSFVELIQRSIYQTETPFVYGILGDWGSGKTSILRLLEGRLKKDLGRETKGFIPIWFNAWRYENEANLIYPLLYAIRRDYQERVEKAYEARDFGQKFLKVVASSTLALADIGVRAATKHLTGEAYKLEEIAAQLKEVEARPGKLEEILGGWADQIHDLDEAFEDLLDQYACDISMCDQRYKADEIRFIIIIDDLDRCLPETTITILESIKNYLAVKRCVFVLGLNPKVIYQGIRIKYHGLDIDGREYLEKILNYSFYVPEPEADRLIQYATTSLEALLPKEEERQEYKGFFREFGQVLRDCKFHNPRKIKRILNNFLLFLGNNEDKLGEFDLANIIRFILMAEYFPGLFELYVDDVKDVDVNLRKILGLYNSNDRDRLDTDSFEKRYSISIKADMPKLNQMKTLFELRPQSDVRKHGIPDQARAVYRITHLT